MIWLMAHSVRDQGQEPPRATARAGIRVTAPRGKNAKEWSVTLGFEHAIPSDKVTDKVDNLLEFLAPAHAAASFKDRSLTVRLTVAASSVRSAMDKALTILLEALREVGIRTTDIYAATAQTRAALAREQEMPNYPELIGVTELAELLRVTRQRASELARAGSGFPLPIAFLASGPVWDKAIVARYVSGWDRRPGARLASAERRTR